MKKKIICVFGSYKKLSQKERDDIISLGKILGENGFDIMSGGFGGTMEDVSKGAKLGGAKTIGVTYYKFDDLPYKSANEFIDEEIRTEDIFERIDIMMRNADGFIILPGGTGTLLELAAVLEHINKNFIKPKPIIAIGDYWKGVLESLRLEPILSKLVKPNSYCVDLVTFVGSYDEAAGKLVSIIK